MKRNIIRENDTIKAELVTSSGKLVFSFYDSYFTSISEVISSIICRAGNRYNEEIKHEVRIYNAERDWYSVYTTSGKKIF